MSRTVLRNWRFRQGGESKWLASKHSEPITEIYRDLLDHGLIPDPFVDRNERDVQWVAEKTWEYECDFVVDSRAAHEDLAFEGLDTIAKVYLNDKLVLESDNMFHRPRVSVGDALKDGKNTLRIVFESALLWGREQEKKHGKCLLWNGESSRAQVRKAQYHYGWDWGPVLMSCGPYRAITLEQYGARIADLYARTEVADDCKTAKVKPQFEIVGDASGVTVKTELVAPSGESVAVKEGPSPEFALDAPQLWYPSGYGSQPLYTLNVTVVDKDQKALWKESVTFGIRKLELVQHELKDEPGTSFFFRVNNVPVFSAGSSWIPAHNMLTKLTRQDYANWISLLPKSNQIMVRVWGGGIYEPDDFYAECDRQGVLVWQDFMFACAQYPYHAEFRKSVEREARDQLIRLRNFCSICILAGNNEDYQVAEQVKLEYDPNDHSGDWTKTNFPARTAYETDLPRISKELTDIPYHPGSPWGGKDTTDPTVGDIHQWNVWHGTQEKYQNWGKLGGRFVSEFGMEAYPAMSTLKKCITDESQLYPQSLVMDSHNKADGFERRIALYVMENFRVRAMDLETWIYITQLMQSECLAYAYRCWRRQWKGPGREYIGGALVWQLNDCWPVISWATCDFYLTPKLSWYAIKRESAPLGVGIYRTTPEDKKKKTLDPDQPGPPPDLVDKTYIYDVWVSNLSLDPRDLTLSLRTFDARSGKLLKNHGDRQVHVAANQSTELLEDLPVDDSIVVQARLLDADGKVVARAADWPQPLKHIVFDPRTVKATARDGFVEVTASGPVKGVMLSTTADNVEWQDNGFDVFPDDVYIVQAPGVTPSTDVSVRFYEQEAIAAPSAGKCELM